MTMMYEPEIVLMDEPFGALDVQTRNLMENDLLEIWVQFRRTVVFDPVGASMGGRREAGIARDHLGTLGALPAAPRVLGPDPGHEGDQREDQGERH